MTISYQRAAHEVRADFGEAHTRYWQRLANAGSWWTGAERIAIAREARKTRSCPLCRTRKEALSPYASANTHAASEDLSEAAVEAVHRITTDAPRLTRKWYDGLLAQGLSDGQYVEIVGTIVATVSIDSFCFAIGSEMHPLPAPVAGEPSQYRPTRLENETAWVAMVPANNEGTAEADLWIANSTANVIRAMSLVPDEVRTLKELSAAHYLPMKDVRVEGKSRGGPLTRSQMELVAAKVSMLNDCFY